MRSARFTGDRAVFALCFAAAIFFAGYEVGNYKLQQMCPVVIGQTVISTVDNGKEQSCTYASSYARVTNKRKL